MGGERRGGNRTPHFSAPSAVSGHTVRECASVAVSHVKNV